MPTAPKSAPAGRKAAPRPTKAAPAPAAPAIPADSGSGPPPTAQGLADKVLSATPPEGWPLLGAVGLVAAGLAASWFVYRGINPNDFFPGSNYAAFAGLFVMALAIERLLEPISGWFVPSLDRAKGDAAQRRTTASRTDAANAQSRVARKRASRAVLMWAASAVLAMLACAVLGIFLLRSIEKPAPAAGSAAPAPTSHHKGSLKDPNRILDLLITGLVVGAGTKPLHDLITQIQASSSSPKDQTSTT